MNGEKFLEDYSHLAPHLLIVAGRQTSMSMGNRKKRFVELAESNNFTMAQVIEFANITKLTTNEVFYYGDLSEDAVNRNWQGLYKGVVYRLNDLCTEIVFTDTRGAIIDVAKIQTGVTFRELTNFCKRKIDLKEIFI